MKHSIRMMAYSLLGACVGTSYAHNQVLGDEFEASVLHGYDSGQTIDLSRFSHANQFAAGKYDVQLYVNQNLKGEITVQFQDIEGKPTPVLCLDQTLWNLMDLKKDALVQPVNENICQPIEQAIPQLTWQFELSSFRLNVAIPQVLTVHRPKGYIPPSQWQKGQTVGFLNYGFNGYHTRYGGDNQHNHSLNVHAGLYTHGWSLIHRGSKSWYQNQSSPYRYYETYAQRDIDGIRGRLIVGDFTTRSWVNSNYAIRGVALVSDQSMLPESYRYYSPLIRGVARTHARVSVYRDDELLYETSVAAGAFQLDDVPVYSANHSGNLRVEITESDGEKHSFLVPVGSSGYLIRPKQWQYEAAVGRYRQNKHLEYGWLGQASLRYGVHNRLTLKSGVLFGNRHREAVVGSVWDTGLGILESDLMWKRHHFGNQTHDTQREHIVRLGYEKDLFAKGPRLYLNFQKNLSSDSANGRHQPFDYRYTVSLNQSLGESGRYGHLYFSGTRSAFKGSKPEQDYQVSYGNHFKSFNYQFSFGQTHNKETGRKNKQFVFDFSVPFDLAKHRAFATGNYTRASERDTARSGISGTYGQYDQIQYGATIGRSNKHNHYSVHVAYQAPYTTVQTNASYANGSRQWGYGLSGSVVGHRHGITFAPQVGDTFALIHAKNAAGMPTLQHKRYRLDRWGNGVVPYLSPYRRNRVGIKTENLPDYVQIEANDKEIIPRAYSAHVVDLSTKTAYPILFKVRLPDGSQPAFASEARLESDEQSETAYVGQNGQLFMYARAAQGKVRVQLGEQSCSFDYRLPSDDVKTDLITLPVVCEYRRSS